jgi:hypothetical protein
MRDGMANANLFQYLSAFVTIMLAIALTDLLMSFHRLIQARKRVRWAILPLFAALYVFLCVVSEFFSVWVTADVSQVSYFYLLLLIVVSGTIALSAFSALPDEVPAEGLSLWDYYLENRRYLFITLAIAFLGDLLRTVVHDSHGGTMSLALPEFWLRTGLPTLFIVAVYIALAWAKDARVHVAGLTAICAVAISNYIGWSIR